MEKIIEIEELTFENKTIYFDVPTSNFFLPNTNQIEIIDNIEKTISNSNENIFECINENLKEDFEELKNKISINYKEEKVRDNFSRPVFTLVLHPSRKCNLSCKYCFGFDKKISNKEIDIFTAKKAIDFLVDEIGKKQNKYIIDLSGSGEPILKIDFIKEIHTYCKEKSKKINKEILVTFVSNGTLLNDEVLEYLNKTDILFGVSLDGHKELNDKLRVYKDNTGTFEDIIENVRKIKDKSHFGLAVTLTGKHKNIKKIYETLFDLDIASTISIKPVRGKDNAQFSIDKSNIDEIKNGYLDLFYLIIEKIKKGEKDFLLTILKGEDYFGKFIKRILRKSKVHRRCDAGISRMTVNEKGELFLCPVKIDEPEFKIGDILNGLNEEKMSEIKKINISSIEKCKNCWSRYICGGECFVVANDVDKSFTTPDEVMCDLKKHLIKLSIFLVNNIIENFEDFYDELMTFVIRQDVYLGSDAGAYTLNKLANHHDVKTTIVDIRENANITETGIAPLDLMKVSKKIGLNIKPAKGKIEDLIKINKFPIIAHYKGEYGSVTNYYGLVTNITNENIIEVDDAILGKLNYSIEEFSEIWSGLAFMA